jgi:anti-sigma factor RsiW
MNDRSDNPTEPELIAYLDGELPAEQAGRFEQRLAGDDSLREELRQHQQVWDLLDTLPRTDVDETFTHSTVELVALSAQDEIQQAAERASRRQRHFWWIAGEVIVVAALLGFLVIRLAVTAPNRQLVKDLDLLENLDAYRTAEDLEFLRALEREGLFSVEGEDDW